MFFLQAIENATGISGPLFFGTLGMFLMAIGIVVLVIFQQRKVIRYQLQMKKLEDERQQLLLHTEFLACWSLIKSLFWKMEA